MLTVSVRVIEHEEFLDLITWRWELDATLLLGLPTRPAANASYHQRVCTSASTNATFIPIGVLGLTRPHW
jgi:hypothetical protein